MDLSLPTDEAPIPADVRTFLDEADRRVERFRMDRHIPGFVASDFPRVYGAVRGLVEANLTRGNGFCEWGSGFGVTACLAAMLDFDACGLETEGELVGAAQQLAADFSLPVEFFHGSFIPAAAQACLGDDDTFAWLNTEDDSPEEELGLGPADFDVIFAYPWPDEERLIGALFERHARAGAVLVTYHGGDDLRARRKVRRRSRRPSKR